MTSLRQQPVPFGDMDALQYLELSEDRERN
jgi:hypothetical protein